MRFQDICRMSGFSDSAGNLVLLELGVEGLIELECRAETLEDCGAILTLKGRTLVTEHLCAIARRSHQID